MKIKRVDPFTGKENQLDIDVTEEQYYAWMNGTLIQHAMPQLSADHREFLMTGIMPDSWDAMMGGE